MIIIFSEVISFITVLLVLALILYLSYVVSCKVGGRMIRIGGSSNIRIIDQAIIGREKSIIVVRVGQKDYLLGVSQNSISLLQELEEGQVMDGEMQSPDSLGFVSFLKDRMKNGKEKGRL